MKSIFEEYRTVIMNNLDYYEVIKLHEPLRKEIMQMVIDIGKYATKSEIEYLEKEKKRK